MKTEWDLDINVITFVLSDQKIERQRDEYPVIFDLDQNGVVVEVEVVLPFLEDLRVVLAAVGVLGTDADTIVNVVEYGNMRAMMYGTAIAHSDYVGDKDEVTVRKLQNA